MCHLLSSILYPLSSILYPLSSNLKNWRDISAVVY